jgi:hypothetical protein
MPPIGDDITTQIDLISGAPHRSRDKSKTARQSARLIERLEDRSRACGGLGEYRDKICCAGAVGVAEELNKSHLFSSPPRSGANSGKGALSCDFGFDQRGLSRTFFGLNISGHTANHL